MKYPDNLSDIPPCLPTWSKPGKWHKWAMQLFINTWHYLQWLFTNMYIHHLITYSCTKSIKMLWALFLPLTNLLISFHQLSHVSLHQHTTFIHLQLSSLCNWPSAWLHPLQNIPSWATFVVLCSSSNFCNISQNMHSKAPVASQNEKTNDHPVELLHMKDLLPERVTI